MTLATVERLSSSGYVPLPRSVLLEERTGHPSFSPELLALEGTALFPRRPLFANPMLRSSITSALGSHFDAFSSTSYGTTISFDQSAWTAAVSASDPFYFPTLVVKSLRKFFREPSSGTKTRLPPVRQRAAQQVTPAEEIRALTQLSPGKLAALFQVSRTTFYNWIDGATPRDERFQHLLDALTHVKDARQRLPQNLDFTAWLRTPISPGAKTPLDYLRDRQFSVFRGLVLRATSASMGLTPVASVIPGPPLTRAEMIAARERLSPSPRMPDDEDD